MPSIQFQQATIHYHVIGNGPKPLLAFHGFGQDGLLFNDLGEKLSNEYTLYLFDLFFHGKSEWNYGEQPLEKDFWKNLLHQVLDQHKISTFSVLGFSMGGKFALATLEAFPTRAKEIFLFAADGVKVNTWYKLATYPLLTRKLFKSMILNHQRFLSIGSTITKLGFLDKSVLRFAESQMNTEAKRKQVYFSWVVFRHLKFSITKIASLISSQNIKATIVVGKFDRIAPPETMDGLVKKLKTCQFTVLETGHNGLITKWLESLKGR